MKKMQHLIGPCLLLLLPFMGMGQQATVSKWVEKPHITTDYSSVLIDPVNYTDIHNVNREVLISLRYHREEQTDVAGQNWTYRVNYRVFADPLYMHTGELYLSGGEVNPVYAETDAFDIFQNGNSTVIFFQITSVEAFNNGVAVNDPANSAAIPNDIRLEYSIVLNDYYAQFNTNSLPTLNFDSQAGTVNVSTIAWADYYDIEWVFIDEETPFTASTYSENIAHKNSNPFLFKEATRVQTPFNHYQTGTAYPRGTLYIRARGVGKERDQTTGKVRYVTGRWGYLNQLSGHVITQDFEADKNWQSVINYAEQGKKKLQLTYADGLLNPRQNLTQLNTQEQLLIQNTVYDYEGRPAVSILPAPADNTQLDYHTHFNMTWNASEQRGTAMSAADFEKRNSPALPLSPESGAGKYYANEHDNYLNPWDKSIPDAEGFPYAHTTFTNDHTGRPASQGNVGPLYQVRASQGDDKHETRYIYAKPNNTELKRLFGSNAGSPSHYEKNYVIDPNGQVSASILDYKKRVVATCLVGDEPDNLHAVYNDNFEAITVNLGVENEIVSDENKLSSISTHIFANATIGTNYDFTYVVNKGDIFHFLASENCLACQYELEIRVYLPDGSPYLFDHDEDGTGESAFISEDISPGDLSCEGLSETTINQTISFTVRAEQIGKYTIVKKLSPNDSVAKAFEESLKQAVGAPDSAAILADFMANINYDPCNLSCYDYVVEHLTEELGRTPTETEIETRMATECNGLDLISDGANSFASKQCEADYQRMIDHVTPGGVLYENNIWLKNAADTYLPDEEFSTAQAVRDNWVDDFAELLVQAHYEWSNYQICLSRIDVQNELVSYNHINSWDEYLAEYNGNAEALLDIDVAVHGLGNLTALYDNYYPIDPPNPSTAFYKLHDYLDPAVNTNPDLMTTFYRDENGVVLTDPDAISERRWQTYLSLYNGLRQEAIENNSTYRYSYLNGDPEYKIYIDQQSELPEFRHDIQQMLDDNITQEYYDEMALSMPEAWWQNILLQCPDLSRQLTEQQVADIQNSLEAFFLAYVDLEENPLGLLLAEDIQADLEKEPNSLLKDALDLMTSLGCDHIAYDVTYCEDEYEVNWFQLTEEAELMMDLVETFFEMHREEDGNGNLSNDWTKEGHVDMYDGGYACGSHSYILPFYTDTSSSCSGQEYNKLTTLYNQYLQLIQSKYPQTIPFDGMGLRWYNNAACNSVYSNGFELFWFRFVNNGERGYCLDDHMTNEVFPVGYSTNHNTQPDIEIERTSIFRDENGNPQALNITQDLSSTTIEEFKQLVALSCVELPGGQTGVNIEQREINYDSETYINPETHYYSNSENTFTVGPRFNFFDLLQGTCTSNCGIDLIFAKGTSTNTYRYICNYEVNIEGLDLSDYDYQSPCRDELDSAAKYNGIYEYKRQYEAYVRQVRDAYYQGCYGRLSEDLSYTFTPKEYQYTLYYYDQADNLVQTVPPEGVKPLAVSAFDAKGNYLAGNEPEHTMLTTYQYNSYNQVVEQTTPDGGTTRFYYNALGQLRFSVSAQQAIDDEFSYTKYDALGRVTESGESNEDINLNGSVNDMNIPATGWNITRIYYDEAVPAFQVGHLFASGQQENLRNRVASIERTQPGLFNGPGEIITRQHYSYDIHGNVNELVNENSMLPDEFRYQHLRYEYDLLTGNVNEVAYQEGKPDQFFHRYTYDADNRITRVKSGRSPYMLETDARYFYYTHGPLARVETGHDLVQAQDYAYTLQGWLKGVNAATLVPKRDMGKDGQIGNRKNLHRLVAQDAVGFSLGYNSRDYQSIGNTDFLANTRPVTGSDRDLFNGNIRSKVTGLTDIDHNKLDVTANVYEYDQLNRLINYRSFASELTNELDPVRQNNSFNGIPDRAIYRADYSYDKNGNLETLNRNGNQFPPFFANNPEMDRLTYRYDITSDGRKVNNRLRQVNDEINAETYDTDIDNQQAVYQYDASGNLIQDISEAISNIAWNADGKIARITKSNHNDLQFVYDPAGNRVAKIVGDAAFDAAYTFYVRDAQGNVMATYHRKFTPDHTAADTYEEAYQLTELPVYGSARLGIRNEDLTLYTREVKTNGYLGTLNKASGVEHQRDMGKKHYEMTDHLGNVLATVSDRKTATLTFGGGHEFTSTFNNRDHDEFNRSYAYQHSWGHARTGNHSAFMPVDGINALVIKDFQDVEPGDRFSVSVWAKHLADYPGRGGNVSISLFDENNVYVANSWRSISGEESASAQWNELRIDDYVVTDGLDPNKTYKARVLLWVPPSSSPTFFDDIDIQYNYEQVYEWGFEQLWPLGDDITVIHELTRLITTFDEYEQGFERPDYANADIDDVQKAQKLEKIVVTLSGNGENDYDGLLLSSAHAFGPSYRLAVVPGDVVSAEVWARHIDPGTGALLKACLLDEDGNTVYYQTSDIAYTQTEQWHLHTVAFPVPNDLDAEELTLQVYAWKPENRVDTWFDDLSISLNGNELTAYYQAEVVSAQDYYPFGSILPGRSFNSNAYRYGGAGGQEKDDEIYGTGNSYTAQYWQYDPRLGRRWNIDPITYPWHSSYLAFNNNPVTFIDPLGLFGSRREARKFRKKHQNHFIGKSRLGRGVDENGNKIFILEREDGQQFSFGSASRGYNFRKEVTIGMAVRNFFEGLGRLATHSRGSSDSDAPSPVSKVKFSAGVSHTSGGIKNKGELILQGTCETCTDVVVQQTTSAVVSSGTQLKNPSEQEVSANIVATFTLVNDLPIQVDANGKAQLSYGGVFVSYTADSKNLSLGFRVSLGTGASGRKGEKSIKSKGLIEKEIEKNVIYD